MSRYNLRSRNKKTACENDEAYNKLFLNEEENNEEDEDYIPDPEELFQAEEEEKLFLEKLKRGEFDNHEELLLTIFAKGNYDPDEDNPEFEGGIEGEGEMDKEEFIRTLLFLKELLEQTEEDNVDDIAVPTGLSPKQAIGFKKILKRIKDEEPTHERILDSKMPVKDKTKLIKMVESYRRVEPMTLEFWMIRDLLDEKIKEWEKLNKEERVMLKKLSEDIKEDESLPRQIVKLNAPDEVKKGIMTIMSTSDMHDSTHLSRLKIALKIPFNTCTPLKFSDRPKHVLLNHVKDYLNDNLYGMENVKKQLLVTLNLRLSNPNMGSSVLLNGPPGVGKTMIAHCLAKAMGVYFYKISLGNLDDAKILTGGEAIWKGSNVSGITQGLIEAEGKNPIILLDEIDKNRSKHYGQTVENALLQILDPTQNHNYRDLNIPEVPIDLSAIWWIATSNSIEHISKPLLSRLRLIEVPEYSTDDLKNITIGYVIPSICKRCGIHSEDVSVSEEAIESMILSQKSYIDQLGVRFIEDVFEKAIGELMLQDALDDKEEKDKDKACKYVISKDSLTVHKKERYHNMYL